MEETIIQRINLILKENSITVTAIARRLNLSQTTLSLQLKGERALSAHIVELILSAFPEVSAEWLLRGEGEMYKRQSSVQIPSATSYNDSEWKAKYEELEKRYDQLFSALCGRTGGGKHLSNVG